MDGCLKHIKKKTTSKQIFWNPPEMSERFLFFSVSEPCLPTGDTKRWPLFSVETYHCLLPGIKCSLYDRNTTAIHISQIECNRNPTNKISDKISKLRSSGIDHLRSTISVKTFMITTFTDSCDIKLDHSVGLSNC